VATLLVVFTMAMAGPCVLVTCSIAHSTKRQYVSYSKNDFEVFAPQGQHVPPIWVKFHPIGATMRVKDPQKWKF